jgi:hypothetical protein
MTSNSLIESIKVRASVPISQNTFQDTDLLRFANEEINNNMLPLIMGAKEEYYVFQEDQAIVSGKNKYKIPYRAIGSKLRDIFYKASDTSRAIPLSRIQPEDKSFYSDPLDFLSTKYFYIEGGDIVLIGDVGGAVGGVLQMTYYLQPNELVKESRVPNIVAITENTLNNQATLTLTSMPNNITIGSLIDLLETKPNHRTYKFDIPVISVDTTLKTLIISLDDLPDNLQLGDMVASAGETKIPQVPADLHVIVAQSVAARVLEALGDDNGLKAANDKLKKMMDNALILINDRVEGAAQKVFNAQSLMRLSTLRRGFKKIYY